MTKQKKKFRKEFHKITVRMGASLWTFEVPDRGIFIDMNKASEERVKQVTDVLKARVPNKERKKKKNKTSMLSVSL